MMGFQIKMKISELNSKNKSFIRLNVKLSHDKEIKTDNLRYKEYRK